MRVLIADDQANVRAALRLLLNLEPELTIVGEAVDAADLLAQIPTTHPDLVLLDWELPGFDVFPPVGIKTQSPHLLGAIHRSCKVVALSGRLGAAERALEAGVDAFVSKGDLPECLLATLRDVVAADKLTRDRR